MGIEPKIRGKVEATRTKARASAQALVVGVGVEAQKEALEWKKGRARNTVMAEEAEAKTRGKVGVTITKTRV